MHVTEPTWKAPGRLGRSLLFLLVALLIPAFAAKAHASGITLAHYGGIYGHANADGGLALYWNPARLSQQEGFFFNLDFTGIRRKASYDRFADFDVLGRLTNPYPRAYMEDPQIRADFEAANGGLATTSAAAVLPYAALGYGRRFGNVGVAAAVGLVPAFGGAGEWDKNLAAPSRHPGAVDGPQRWSSISSSFMIIHYTSALSLTMHTPLGETSIGGSLIYGTASIETTRARNLNRSDALVDPQGVIEEGRIYFEGGDSGLTGNIALSQRINLVTASLVYRFRQTFTISGDLDQAYSTQPRELIGAYTDFPTPPILQGAVSAELGPALLTGIIDYTRWSVMESNDIRATSNDQNLLRIPRNLRNTVSLRGLAEWSFSDRFSVGGTVGWDPSAVPPSTIDASLADADKIKLGGGVQVRVSDNLLLRSSLAHEFFFEVNARNNIQEPQMNGDFNDARTYLNLSIEGRFP